MISLDAFRKLLPPSEKKFSDADLSEIRRKLYNLAKLEYELFKEKCRRDEECNNLQEGQH